ncbi:MAG TPA: ATP-binding cassette domain-containing protein, partial [Burkholderiales bacterium]|nr:ATP-binding cassette domain-containing protein [Burkholderiales bacterium]
NGAGKTTLIQQLSGALRPDGGAILLDGRDVTRASQHQRVHLGMARSYQVTSIFRGVSVLHNLALAVLGRRGSSLRFWRPLAREGSLFEEARALAGQVGLAGREHALAGALAHGEQRQLEVGLALATGARLLLLDEPLAGLGPEEIQRVVGLIGGLKGAKAVLLVEHDMDAVFRLADRISVLDSGRIIATGTPQSIRNDAEVKRAYLGDEVAFNGMPA